MRITCRICRRVGASVCGREKCAFKRKPYAPGIHGKGKKRRREGSEFSTQLRDKQVVRFSYGISESQFRAYVMKSLAGYGGNVVQGLISLLEMRLDNVVYRLGFAPSRALARQLVSHGHITVGGRKVFVPSYQVRAGQVVAIAARSQSKGAFQNLDATLQKQKAPDWLTLEPAKREGVVMSLPKVEDVVRSYNIKSIIEFYSK
ncbi:MAG: 30S ribosomal protein S4 [Patescibacteria group bacterium]